jgi:hypothetical protein
MTRELSLENFEEPFMEQATSSQASGQFIYLSRNSKLARLFQDAATKSAAPAPSPPAEIAGDPLPAARVRTAPGACPKLQAVGNPSLELSRPLAAALMREQASMRCRSRGVMLDNEYVRDICAAGAHQHCPFLAR